MPKKTTVAEMSYEAVREMILLSGGAEDPGLVRG